MQPRFVLSSAECELLLAFEAAPSLRGVAERLGKDLSVVSRQLTRLASVAQVIEKRDGCWQLSRLGRELARWTRDAITSQRETLADGGELRIAATAEFAARVLAPNLAELLGEGAVRVQVIATETGVEKLLLEGLADLGFDCGRPDAPDVRFELVSPEPFSALVAPQLLAQWRPRTIADLELRPHLFYTRAPATRYLKLRSELGHVVASFNSISATRAACVAGLGWSLLPSYAVQDEIERGELRVVPGVISAKERFGVFWLRERRTLMPWVRRSVDWLRARTLDAPATVKDSRPTSASPRRRSRAVE